MSDWPTGLMLIQGNRMEDLRALMVAWMRRYPLGPLEDEVVLVQSNGIGQWLKLALAAAPRSQGKDAAVDEGGLGIAAAIELLLPGQFVWRVYRAVLGDLPEQSPFDKGPLTWRLYRLFARIDDPEPVQPDPASTGQALLSIRPLLAERPGVCREQVYYRLAAQVADLFDQYQVYRADWLADWSQGKEVIRRADGSASPLPADQAWQPALWRWLCAEISGSPATSLANASRAEVHRAFMQARDQGRLQTAPLPRRVIVFGISTLPQQTLEVLGAIASVSQVLVFALNPSRHYWGDLIDGRELFRPYRRNPARKVPEGLAPHELHLHGHPLLAAWGRQGRDYLRLLDVYDERTRYEGRFADLAQGVDLFTSPGDGCLLHQLQDDILELRSLQERQAMGTVIDPRRDRSIEFMIASSPQREIEILHDRLLAEFEAALAGDRPLAPRDVLVMVPEISDYVPHIQAVFGRLDPDDPRYIPFQIADLKESRQNTLVLGFTRLLALPTLRLTASELCDWLEIPALRTRLGLDEPQVMQLRRWIAEANIRWGRDAEQRAALDLPAGLQHHTWRFGLQRLLLGMANGASGPWQGIEPVDGIGGLESALLGPLSELIARLGHYWRLLRAPHPAAEWVEVLGSLLDDLFAPVNETDDLALAQIAEAIDCWAADCAQGGLQDEPIPYTVFRDAFLPYLDPPRLGQHFVGGAVHFATLMPMRAIPFRQIWILGMNEGDYPRPRIAPAFDLMAGDYRPGDRSRREDDRYLFLEALLSARDKLVIGWVGRDARDNSERQPSVLVAQLRDHIAAGWRLPAGETGSLADALTTLYPLQPFSRSYFLPQRPPQVFTYAAEWRAAHGGERTGLGEDERLETWSPEGALSLSQLEGFLRSPIAALFRQRLRIAPPDEEEAPKDREPFVIEGLERWRIHAHLIERCFVPGLSQSDLEERLRQGICSLQARGELIAGALGERQGLEAIAMLSGLYQHWSEALSEWPEPLARSLRFRVEVDSTAGPLVLEDRLDGLRRGPKGLGQVICQASAFERKGPWSWKNAIGAWVRHLAAQLVGEPVETRLLTPEDSLTFRPLERKEAESRLKDLLLAWWEGMHAPLPVTLESAIAWIESGGPVPAWPISADQEQELRAHSAWSKAAGQFESESPQAKGRRWDLAVRRCYEDFAALWSGGAFAYWSHRLYGGMLRAVDEGAASRAS